MLLHRLLPVLAITLFGSVGAAVASQTCGGEATHIGTFSEGAAGGGYFGLLGFSVAPAGDVNGDGLEDIVAGSPGEPGFNNASSGRVYVYSGGSGALLHLFSGNRDMEDFGYDVAGSFDMDADGIPDLAIGAPGHSSGFGYDDGAVRIYSGATGALILERLGGHGDRFGESIANVGDLDSDGMGDLAITAPFESGIGFLHLWSGRTGAVLLSIQAPSGGEFGQAVDVAGDLDFDGVPDIVVGNGRATTGALFRHGSASVYSGSDGSRIWHWDGLEARAFFGSAVAGTGDVNGDGVSELLIGAYRASPGGVTNAGSAFLFSGADGSLLHRIDGQNEYDSLGKVVAAAGDLDRDGFADFLVGVPYLDRGGLLDVGEAILFSGGRAEILHRFVDRDGQSFPWAAVLSPDTNGDGHQDLLLGSPWHDSPVLNTGAVLVENFDPFLGASAYSFSAAAGGHVDFFLDFPDGEEGEDFFLLGSLTGAGPTTSNWVCIPLTYDRMTRDMLNPPVPLFSNSAGVLGSAGTAQAQLDVPSGVLTGLVGSRAWFAAITLDAGGVRRSSVGISIRIEP